MPETSCKHLTLEKVANQSILRLARGGTVYRCADCLELLTVSLAPFMIGKPYYPKEEPKQLKETAR